MERRRPWAVRLPEIREAVAQTGSWLVTLAPDEVEYLERLGYVVRVNQTGEPEDGERLCMVAERA